MTWNLITVAFGDQKYKQGQQFLTKQAKEYGVNHIEYSDEDLFNSELYKEYPEWMSAENNYGWFTWKPYFILQAMENLKEGDKILDINGNKVTVNSIQEISGKENVYTIRTGLENFYASGILVDSAVKVAESFTRIHESGMELGNVNNIRYFL